MSLNFKIPEKEIEKRKKCVSKVWNYQKVDHIPIYFHLELNPWCYSMQEQIRDKKKQLRLILYNIKKSLKEIPDDYIPGMFLNMGCVAVSSAFGCNVHYGDNPEQTPGIEGPIINDVSEIFDLEKPDIEKDGILPEYFARLKFFLEETEYKIPISCLDFNGITGIAQDLLGTEQFFILMYDHPEALKHLLSLIADTVINIIDKSVEIANGIENMTSTDFFFLWCPEGKKGHTSSDLSSQYSVEFFKEFDQPFNSKIYQKYGPGLIHNCGPNPCASEYLKHDPEISGANLAYRYSIDDLETFKEPFKNKGIIYILFDNETPSQALQGYKNVLEILAPDVIAMPVVFISDEQVDIKRLYNDFLSISKEYTRRIWG